MGEQALCTSCPTVWRKSRPCVCEWWVWVWVDGWVCVRGGGAQGAGACGCKRVCALERGDRGGGCTGKSRVLVCTNALRPNARARTHARTH